MLLKRRVQALGDLSSREFTNLRVALSRYEFLAQQAFQPTKFNYVISGQSDPFFHLHAIPRYDDSSTQEFAQRQWIDSYWPYFPDFPHSVVLTDEWVVEEVAKRFTGAARRWLRR